VREGVQVGDVEPATVDATCAEGGDGDLRRGGQHGRVEPLAVLLGLPLRVVEPGKRLAHVRCQAPVVEEDPRRHEGAGE
jgi:hypothetical protein